jgi:hypothetical protein
MYIVQLQDGARVDSNGEKSNITISPEVCPDTQMWEAARNYIKTYTINLNDGIHV